MVKVKLLKQIALCLLLLFSLISCALISGIGETKKDKIDNYFKYLESRKLFSGYVIVTEDEEITISKGYGYSNLAKKNAFNSDTKTMIASVSKQFTATTVMILYQDNSIDLNDPLTKYFPDFKNGDNITIHNLLSMTSGIPNFVHQLNVDIVTEKIENRYYGFDEIYDYIKDKDLEYEPGTKYLYSNTNYYLLAFLVERVSGVSFSKFLTERIFTPCKMTNSYLYMGDDTNIAAGHRITEYGLALKEKDHWSLLIGCGGIITTAEDMLKWDNALSTELILNNDSKDKMFKSYTKNNSESILKQNYGYGWMSDDELDINGVKRRLVYHGGNLRGYTSFYGKYPDENKTIILLMNIGELNCKDGLGYEISKMIF